jgi:hypothetical protein
MAGQTVLLVGKKFGEHDLAFGKASAAGRRRSSAANAPIAATNTASELDDDRIMVRRVEDRTAPWKCCKPEKSNRGGWRSGEGEDGYVLPPSST